MSISLGQFSFGNVTIDDQAIANALSTFLINGSKKGSVTISSLRIVSDVNPTPVAFENVGLAVASGTRLFDALMYFSLPEASRPVVSVLPAGTGPPTRDALEIGKALFYQAFMLLTRASMSTSSTAGDSANVPGFLRTILSLTLTPQHYASVLASFPIGQMDHSWIRYINWNHMGSEAINRFGLGVAGYRQFGPFMEYPVKADATEVAKEAYKWANAVARTKYDWDIHPVTRNPMILQSYGNLNKNLGNLMLECFTREQLDQMVTIKLLFSVPQADVRHNRWRTWNSGNVPVLTNPIFPDA